jgi:hypothetical protein
MMRNVSVYISSEDAELILFALALRSKQKGLSAEESAKAADLSKYLNVKFEQSFGWCQFDRTKSNRKPIKHVTIKLYDVAPEEATS